MPMKEKWIGYHWGRANLRGYFLWFKSLFWFSSAIWDLICVVSGFAPCMKLQVVCQKNIWLSSIIGGTWLFTAGEASSELVWWDTIIAAARAARRRNVRAGAIMGTCDCVCKSTSRFADAGDCASQIEKKKCHVYQTQSTRNFSLHYATANIVWYQFILYWILIWTLQIFSVYSKDYELILVYKK